MYNRVTLVGNLGRDPELRYTANGSAVCNLSVATNEKWKDSSGELQKRTTWWRVSVWGKQAENCSEYLSKGRPVLVDGQIRGDENGNPRVFERQDGTWGASFDVNAQTVQFLGRGDGAPGSEGADEFDAPPPSEDEIPF